jgi:hypothetical protein
MSMFLTIKQKLAIRKATEAMNYHITDEEGYIYQVSNFLLKEAKRFGGIDSVPFVDYLGDRLEKWKKLPLLTAGSCFKKVGHVLTTRR